MIRKIHHVGIVVERLDDARGFYGGILGLPLVKEAVVPDQRVRAALFAAGESEIELIEPLDRESGVARFLARHGEGLHHLCFHTPDVTADLADLRRRDVALIDVVPRQGLAGRIAFLHPRACAGVLVELATPPEEHGAAVAGPLALKRVVVGVDDPRAATAAFQALFGLPELPINGGARTMLGVGQGAILLVPAGEAGDTGGLLAVSLVAEDFDAFTRRCQDAGIALLRGTGEVTIEPALSHGVPLHVSRHRFP